MKFLPKEPAELPSILCLILGMNHWTIIVPSGGSGLRMGMDRPKQYLELSEKPILLHTLEALDTLFDQPNFIIPIANTWRDYVEGVLRNTTFGNRVEMVQGGEERFDSVKNALSKVSTRWVAVHDAVRPFVAKETVDRLKKAIVEHPAVIPVIGLKESLRRQSENGSVAVDRSSFLSVQTPQCFHTKVLREAYENPHESMFTDDASIVEKRGTPIYTVLGNDENLKITTQTDLIFATHRLEKNDEPTNT